MDSKTVGIVASLFFLIGGFAVVISAMPQAYFNYADRPEYAVKYYPKTETWSILNIGDYRYWENITIYRGFGNMYWFDFSDNTPAYDIKFVLEWIPLSGISLKRLDYQFLGFWNVYSQMNFESNGKTIITDTEMVSHWNGNFSKFSPVFDNVAHVTVFFADWNSTRKDIIAASNEGRLEALIAFGWEDVTRSYDIFSLMGKLLSFQAPEIFGGGIIGIILNALIALPLWGAIATLIAIVLFELIPF